MSCTDQCVFMDYDGDASDFGRSRMVRARKAHVCEECRAPIAIGELHESATGKSDGDWWSSRTCAPCHEIRKAFVCGSWILGELWEEITYQLFPKWNEMTAIDCLAKLTTQSAIDKMRAKYAEYQQARGGGA